MSARIMSSGRTVFATRDWPRRPQPQMLRTAQSEVIAPDSLASPFRLGTVAADPDDGVEYRVVRQGTLDPALGWAPLDFWMRRWKCSRSAVIDLAAHGLLDAAMEHGSITRRFRVRDERKAKEHLSKKTKPGARKA